jgi:hypothetical protein
LLFSIFVASSATDAIINYSLCHPPEQKILPVNFLVNRAQNYPISEEGKSTELSTIKIF